MDYIEARGKIGGETVNVRIRKTAGIGYKVESNDPWQGKKITQALKGHVLVGGTYVAPNGSLLKAYYVLNEIYERGWKCNIHGRVEEIPHDNGFVY